MYSSSLLVLGTLSDIHCMHIHKATFQWKLHLAFSAVPVWRFLFLVLKKATRKPDKNPNKQANKNHHHQTMPGYLILSLFLGSEGQKQWHIIFIFFNLMTVTWSNSVCAWTVLAVYHGSLPSLGSRLIESRMCYWQSGFSSGGKC